MAIIHLGLPLPTASCDLPANIERAARSHRPCGPLGLAPGGVYQATMVTHGAGGLLHHRFTLTTCVAVYFLLHFLAGCPGWLLATALLLGARTFLNIAVAIALPTHPRIRIPELVGKPEFRDVRLR